MRRMHFDGTGGWIGRLLIGTVLAIGALIALAAVAGAQTSQDNPDPNSGTSENSGSGSGNGGSGDGDGDGDSGSGSGDADDGDGDGGSGGGDADDADAVDPEEARIAACAARYGGYQAGWPEQTCRYPNLAWTRTISCEVNTVYSERATGETRNDQGTIWTKMERVVDYACVWDWRWLTYDGGPPPIPESEMIKPHEAETRVDPTKYRLTYWASGDSVQPISQEVVRPSESTSPGSGSGSGSGSGDDDSDNGEGGSGSGSGSGSGDGDSDNGEGGSGSGDGDSGSGSGSGN